MPSLLFQELHQLMLRHRFMPSKDFAQNFIVDEGLIEIMVFHSRLEKKDIVLEIGPGVGFLTEKLVGKCKVIAVEADSRMVRILKERIKSDNLQIIEKDILSAELPEFNKVVSLPPYSISSPLMHRLLSEGFESACLVFQKEFAEKLASEPGFPDYGPISVITNYHCEPKMIIESISPDSFFPKPKSFSSLILLTYSKRFGGACDDALFAEFIQSIFRYKNKNLRNALLNSSVFLKGRLKLSKEEIFDKASALKLSSEKVNLISAKEYVKIFNSLAAK